MSRTEMIDFLLAQGWEEIGPNKWIKPEWREEDGLVLTEKELRRKALGQQAAYEQAEREQDFVTL